MGVTKMQTASSYMDKNLKSPPPPASMLNMDSETETGKEEIIESRFGKIKVNRANAIYFPRGILGFPENLDFCLADMPNAGMERFKILQCMNDTDLSFVVLPVTVKNEMIDEPDIDEACEILGIEKDSLALLLIVSVHRKTTSVSLSVNVRAPLFLDTDNKVAAQFVLPNNKYLIRQFLS